MAAADIVCFIYSSLIPGIIMKVSAMSVLLCFLSVLVVVPSRTFPYIRFNLTNLPNHSYVDFNLVGKHGKETVQCRTNLSTCCESKHGGWYSPKGEKLPNDSNNFDIYEAYNMKHIQLRRRDDAETAGMYRCDIDTSAPNSGRRGTVYAGLYSNGGQ